MVGARLELAVSCLNRIYKQFVIKTFVGKLSVECDQLRVSILSVRDTEENVT